MNLAIHDSIFLEFLQNVFKTVSISTTSALDDSQEFFRYSIVSVLSLSTLMEDPRPDISVS